MRDTLWIVTFLYLSTQYEAREVSVSEDKADLDTLQLVHILHRHGDRTPVEPFPSDPHLEYWTQQGLGQLTREGVTQGVQLGQYIRERYDGFLSAGYNKNEIYVLSTDTDRTLTSAQCVVRGLYPSAFPASVNSSANPDTPRHEPASLELSTNQDALLDFQPVPIHTTPAFSDQMFGKAPCDRLTEHWQEIQHKPEVYNQVKEKHKVLLERIHKLAGYDWVFPYEGDILGKIKNIIDTLYIENLKNMTLPSWVNDTLLGELDQTFVPLTWNLMFYDSEAVKLTGGALIHVILTDIWIKSHDASRAQHKMFMYSAHDNTVLSLLATMKIYPNATPEYTASVMLEFHSRNTSAQPQQSFVKVYFKNGPDQPAELLTLPGCDTECSLADFSALVSDVEVEDRYRACLTDQASGVYEWPRLAVIILASIVGGIMLIQMVILLICTRCCQQWRRAKVHYRYMQNSFEEAEAKREGGVEDIGGEGEDGSAVQMEELHV